MALDYNCRVYAYPDTAQVAVYKKTMHKNGMKEKNKNFTKSHNNGDRSEEAEKHCKETSLSAAKNRIYNIARSNRWEWFITLTFDQKRTDSSDYDIVMRKLHNFLNNLQQRKCPDLKYLIVPEFHADGIHYHFHGLLSDCEGLVFADSGKKDKRNRQIYNIRNWTYGFTTATRIDDTRCASGYLTKYITKESDRHLKNKKHYLCSRNISRTKAAYYIVEEEELLKEYGEHIVYSKNIKVKDAFQSINYYEINYESRG